MFAGRSAAFWSRSLHEVVIFKGLLISERDRKACLSSRFVSPESCLFPGMMELPCHSGSLAKYPVEWSEFAGQVRCCSLRCWNRELGRLFYMAAKIFLFTEVKMHLQRPCFYCWKRVFLILELLICTVGDGKPTLNTWDKFSSVNPTIPTGTDLATFTTEWKQRALSLAIWSLSKDKASNWC